MTGAAILAAALAAPTVAPGAVVTYTEPGTVDAWACVIVALYLGPDGAPWAWLRVEADPRRILRAPVSMLGRP